MYNTQNYAMRIKELADQSIELISNDGSVNLGMVADIINDDVIALLDFDKPKIMVAGIYSAGKSTLINVLCKKQVAEVAASPKTDSITTYPYKDFELIDSPGVDAPIKHEEITDEYIKKCHILLFVISTGMFESEANYRKMYEWIKSGVPFIIVVNDKIGVSDYEAEEIVTIKNKVISNLRKISGDDEITNKYDIIVVNAKRASDVYFGGKSEGLLKLSNIPALENKITAIVQKDSIMHMFANPIANLMNVLDKYESELTSKIAGEENSDIGFKIEQLYRKRNSIIEDIRVQTRSIVTSNERYMIDCLLLGKDIAPNEEKIASEIHELYNMKMQDILLFVKKHFNDIIPGMDNVNVSWEDAGKIVIEQGEETQVVDISDVLATYDTTSDDSEFDANIKAASMALGTAAGNVIGAKIGAAAGTALGGTIGGIAGPVGVIAGMVIGALAGELLSGLSKKEDPAKIEKLMQMVEENNRAEMQKVEAEMRRQQEARMLVQDHNAQLISNIISACSTQINESVNYIIQMITAQADRDTMAQNDIRNKIETVQQIKNELMLIKNNI